MRCILLIPLILLSILFSSCSGRKAPPDNSTLVSIQIIDRNGFSETISLSDRLARYQDVDFTQPQPYQKVFRVFGKNAEGQVPSTLTSYHPNGYLWQYLETYDGRAKGNYSEWFPNGQKKLSLCVIEGMADLSEVAISSWVFDQKNTIWNEEGNLIAEIFYEKGALNGESVYYYPSGQIKKIAPYTANQIHGNYLLYHEDGSVAETIPYFNGSPHGKVEAFFESKQICYKETFEQGRLLEGDYYSKEGELTHTIRAGKGKRAERECGILKRLVSYQKGSPEGLVECFDESGELKITYHQKNDKKHGEEYEYYPRESPSEPLQPKILIHWQEDVIQGVVKTWHQNGVQESQKEMYQNKKSGTAFAWYTSGDLMLAEEYEKDLLTSGTYYKKGDRKPVSKVTQGKGTATLYHPEGYFLQKAFYDKGIPSLDKD